VMLQEEETGDVKEVVMRSVAAGKNHAGKFALLWTVVFAIFALAAPELRAQDDSCVGHCGGDTGVCYCDDLCYLYGDCCYDVCDACPDLDGCFNEAECTGDVDLCTALDNCDFDWSILSFGNWFGQSSVSHDGTDAARSACIAPTEESILETTVGQSGTLSFWWQVSSEADYDMLGFHVDGILQDQISGLTNWVHKSFHVNAGQTVQWRYSKDESVNSGSDCGWVDEVTFVRDDALSITPLTGFYAAGYQNGPFVPSSKAYTVTNTGAAPLVWSVSGDGTGWVNYSPAGGTLAPGASASFSVLLNAGADTLAAGAYSFEYTVRNTGTGYEHVFQGSLTVNPIPGEIYVVDTVAPTNDLDIPFGDVILGMSRTEQINIFNADSTHDLVISEVTLLGAPAVKSLPEIQVSASVPDNIPVQKADTSRPHQPGQLIVGFKPGLKRADADGLHASLKAKRLRSYKLIPADVVQLPENADIDKAIAAYAAMPGVAYAEPNYQVHALALPNDALIDGLWGMNNTGQSGGTPNADINAPEAWEFTTGSPDVIVGVIDTGVDYTHEDLATNIWTNLSEYHGTAGVDDDGNGIVDDIHGARWTNGDGNVTSGDPMDGNGHGTHCSGTIGAVGNNGTGVAGVNWSVSIMGLKFLDDSGSGYEADAIAALEYAIDKGAHLTSNSWGGGAYSQGLVDAIVAAGAANQLMIAAAGNDYGNNNDENPMYPASYTPDNIIAVAASDHNDAVAYFSNVGPTTVDLAAPGVNILSTVPGNGYDGSYSGTSMATPHVAGVAALLLSRNPGAPYQEVKRWILENVTPLPQWEGVVLTGGRLNAAEALLNSNPHFQLDNASALPLVIAPGGSASINVTYAPIAVGDHAAQVRITSNDMDEPDVRVTLSGSCREDDLAVSPWRNFVSEGYQFGSLLPQCMTYTLTNRGGAAIEWTLSLNATWMTASSTGGSLAPGASVTVDICLSAEATQLAPGEYTADILVTDVTSGWQGTQSVHLNVLANPGEILVEDTIPLPEDLDMPFGTLVIKNARTEQVTVTNANDDYDLTINQIGLVGSIEIGSSSAQMPDSTVEGRMPADFHVPPNAILATGRLNVLLLATGEDGYVYVNYLRSALLAFPDMNRVDVFDAAAAVPDASLLAEYNAVVVMSEYPFADSVATGNALADYVDAGGCVIQAVATFAEAGLGLELGGRFMTQGYSPFLPGELTYNMYPYLGSHDPRHPIMQGVSDLQGDFIVDVEMKTGAEWVADWYDGTPLVAVWNQKVVGINYYAFDYGTFAGDVETLFHNAIVYVADRPFRIDDPPTLPATLAPGQSVTFSVSFAPQAEGKYSGLLRISSNDKDEPDATVTLSGLAVGGEFALEYTGRNPVLAAVGDRVSMRVQSRYSRGTVTYQWYRVTENKTLEPLTGQTDAVLVFFPLEWNDAGDYQCVATDTVAGAAASPIIALEVVKELPLSHLAVLAALLAVVFFAGTNSFRRTKME